jgi:hypothetical protein
MEGHRNFDTPRLMQPRQDVVKLLAKFHIADQLACGKDRLHHPQGQQAE